MSWKKFVLLPGWAVAALTGISAGALGWVFTTGREKTVLAYALFALSFYTVCVVTLWGIFSLPKLARSLRRRIEGTALGGQYLHDKAFRSRVSLWVSLGINLLFAGVQLVSWHLSGSAWFAIFAGYYGILAVMRLLLLGAKPDQRGRARLCGVLLLLLNLTLSGAVLMMLYQGRGFDYPGIAIYVMALYTFYAVIHGAVAAFRRSPTPVLKAAKVISLCAALVSLLNLESAMFAQFGADMPEQTQRLFIMLTGAGVSAAIIPLSVWVIKE